MSWLYDMLEDNEGGSLSTARVTSFACSIIGIILCILGFFGIGSDSTYAYILIGIGTGSSAVKSIISQFTNKKETK